MCMYTHWYFFFYYYFWERDISTSFSFSGNLRCFTLTNSLISSTGSQQNDVIIFFRHFSAYFPLFFSMKDIHILFHSPPKPDISEQVVIPSIVNWALGLFLLYQEFQAISWKRLPASFLLTPTLKTVIPSIVTCSTGTHVQVLSHQGSAVGMVLSHGWLVFNQHWALTGSSVFSDVAFLLPSYNILHMRHCLAASPLHLSSP